MCGVMIVLFDPTDTQNVTQDFVRTSELRSADYVLVKLKGGLRNEAHVEGTKRPPSPLIDRFAYLMLLPLATIIIRSGRL